MRTLATVAALLLFNISISAQKNDKDIPAWGKIEKADLELKECDFDKKAEAMVLFDMADIYCGINYNSMYPVTEQTERFVRIKILTDKGLDRANIHIPFNSNDKNVNIRNLAAQIYNLDEAGNIVATKVEKNQIFTKKINKYRSELVFTFPQVKPGSVFEYKFMYDGGITPEWYFQRSIPVKMSRYKLTFPYELEVNVTPYISLPMDAKKVESGTSYTQTYTMTDVPALRDEEYISCDEDYLQRLETRLIAVNFRGEPRKPLMKNWPTVIKELMEDEDFGGQLKKNIPRTADLDLQLKSITSPYLKMKTIYNYVRTNMEWDGDDNIWALAGVKSAWKDKKGTSGEINLILVNLLKDAGINAHPVLVAERGSRRINTMIADYDQFDKVLAYVTIDDRTYVLDATEKYTPAHLIPYGVMYSEGLVIEKLDTYEWGWQPLWDEQQQKKTTSILSLNIDDKSIHGEVSVNSYDYDRVTRMPILKKGKDKFLETYFTSNNPGVQIDSFWVKNEQEDSLPLVQQIRFSEPISSSGDYKYFTVNMFTGLEKNPFIIDNRVSDVFFGVNQTYNIIANVNIPEGYEFDQLPKSVRMIMPDTSISILRRCAAEKNQLSVRINLEFKKPIFATDEYADFKEFYKKLFDLLNEQFVIRKKANP